MYMNFHCVEQGGLIKLQILEDYGSQLSHLAKELSQIRNDFAEWEQPTTGGYGTGR